MFLRGRQLYNLSPFDLLDNATKYRRRGFIIRGVANVLTGTSGLLISETLSDDWYHFRYMSWFVDPSTPATGDLQLVIRVNGSPLAERFGTEILSYIPRRGNLDFRAIGEPRGQLEVFLVNNTGKDQAPQVVLTGIRSRYRDRLEAQ
jgi:hypothetical protein